MNPKSKLSVIEDTHLDVKLIKHHLFGKLPPEHFGPGDLVKAFIGAIVVGLDFIFKSAVLNAAERLSNLHLVYVVVFTVLMLSAEIYFIGYTRVKDKIHRQFFQFWVKRLVTIYLVAILVSMMLFYMFAFDVAVQTSFGAFKVILTVSLPCAVGAAIADLLKKY